MQEAFVILDACDEVPILSERRNETHMLGDSMTVNRSRLELNHGWIHQQRQHKRTELSQLQMQSQRMDMYFSRLTIDRGKRDSKRTRVSPATLHMQELQEPDAELFNLSLQKSPTHDKYRLHPALRKEQSMETVSLSRSTVLSSEHSGVYDCSPSVLQNDPVAARREIMTRMDDMYTEAKALINPYTGAAASLPALSCHYNVTLDPKKGPISLLTSETPLGCSLDLARELLSAIIPISDSFQLALNTRATRSHADGETKNSIEVGGSDVTGHPDGLGLTRRHTQKDSEISIWAAISFHQSGKILFRESLWMAATNSAQSVSDESVVRVNYRLSAEKAEGCTLIDGEHIDHIRNQAIEAIGAKMKKNHHMLQMKMLIETGRSDMASLIT